MKLIFRPAVVMMQRFLNKEGFRVETARSGPEGLQRAREMQPSVITLDVMMPHMDGWAVLTALKADPVLNTIPVILVTIVDQKEMGFMLGASDYRTKPVDRAPDRSPASLQMRQRAMPGTDRGR
jgi:CheY-like chemotaxis protein